jgi:hypothetical protein
MALFSSAYGRLELPALPLALTPPSPAGLSMTPTPTFPHGGGGERWLTERSSRLMPPASTGMGVMLSPQGKGEQDISIPFCRETGDDCNGARVTPGSRARREIWTRQPTWRRTTYLVRLSVRTNMPTAKLHKPERSSLLALPELHPAKAAQSMPEPSSRASCRSPLSCM